MVTTPARRSPIDRLGIDTRAVGEHSAGPMLVDLSALPRLGFKGRGTIPAMQRRSIAVEAEPNRVFRQADGGLCLVLAQTEVLLLSGPDGDGSRLAEMEHAWRIEDEERTYPLPRQDSHAWFALVGDTVPEMFATLCGVDLRLHKFPDGSIAQTSLARLNVILARADAGHCRLFHLLADSASAEYLWTCLATALAGIGGHVANSRALGISSLL